MSCAAATVAAGLAIRAAGGRLGTALPPFVSPWAPRVGAQGHKVAFVHPKATGGVLVELVDKGAKTE